MQGHRLSLIASSQHSREAAIRLKLFWSVDYHRCLLPRQNSLPWQNTHPLRLAMQMWWEFVMGAGLYLPQGWSYVRACKKKKWKKRAESNKKKAALAWTTPLWDFNGNSRRFALSANLLYFSASPACAEEPTRSVTNNSKWCSTSTNKIACSCRRANTIGHQQL